LRVLLQDQLFIRVGQVMKPTARAESLSPKVRRALEHMQDVLYAGDTFDPKSQQRIFRVGFSSEVELLLLPGLTARLREIAPGIRLISRPVSPEQIYPLLDEGAFDIGVGCFGEGASRHRTEFMFEQSLSCCYNPARLPLTMPIDVETYLTTGHALVTWSGAIQGCINDALDQIRTRLHVVMASSEFLTVLAATAEAPVIATVPTRMAKRYAPLFGLQFGPVPIDLKLPDVAMVWTAQTDRDPGSEWLRGEIRAVLAEHAL